MLADLKFALRQLRKSPGFTLTAVLTLALGIGANAAIFTLVNSILLRPLPFPQQSRLMRIGYGGFVEAPFPKGWVRALGEHSASFSGISGFGPDAQSNVGEQGSPDRVFGAQVMVNALDVLGIHPALGRFFTPEEMLGQNPVVILSYGYWRQLYAANPDVIGSTLRIDGIDRRIIGVLPAGVHFPYAETQFLTPVTFSGTPYDPWDNFDINAFGRLKPGVTPLQAQGELSRLQKALLPMFPWTMPSDWAAQATVVPLLETVVGAVRLRLLLLFAAVGLILLIACANVAGLMLARASRREREMAVRGALGASSGRLIRQLLSESVVLGVFAGIAGLLATAAGLRALISLLPSDTPRVAQISIHWPVVLFAAGVSVLTGLLFGLIPAVRMSSPHLVKALHSSGRTVAGKRGQFRVSTVLVMAQIALSVVVISAAGLMLHTLWRISQANPGFRTDRVVTAEVSLDASVCPARPVPFSPSPGRCQSFFTTLLDHLNASPGEENVALTDALPLAGNFDNLSFDAEGKPRGPHQMPLLATQRIVSPGYFSVLGMSLIRGRLLEAQDASGVSRAAVISQHMAETLWPHQNPIGLHLLDTKNEIQPAQWISDRTSVVVGVVSDTRDITPTAPFGNEVYFPMTSMNEDSSMYVLLRTHLSPAEAASQLRQVVAAIDPQVPVTRVQSLNEIVAASESGSRSLALLLLAFGGLAVMIGGVGVYSLMAFIVNWRTQEIGIRLALGAQRAQILNNVVRQSLVLSLGGCVVGLAGAILAGQMLRSFLYGVSTVDPVTFGAVAMLMVVLAIVAAWIPARRAASVDPITTLRQE
jgi:predicted permease